MARRVAYLTGSIITFNSTNIDSNVDVTIKQCQANAFHHALSADEIFDVYRNRDNNNRPTM